MVRVTVSVDDSILSKADHEANKRGLSRSQYVAEAIESYVTGINRGDEELHKANLELNKSQTEVMQLNRKIAKLENQLAEKDKELESKASELMQADKKLNQAYAEVMQAKAETSKYEMAIKLKDDEIFFLRGHVSQLSEKITPALPPSQEEAKKKHWWRFWQGD